MVNHVKTLLLNRSVTDMSYVEGMTWTIDPSFVPVVLDRGLRSFRDSMFIGVSGYDISGQVSRVDAVASLVLSPENQSLQTGLDTRVTEVVSPPLSVFEFYGSVASEPANPGFVGEVLKSAGLSSVFGVPEGVSGDIASAIGRYRSKWESSPETIVRFVSAVSAYVLRLEALRLRSSGKAS